MKPFAVISNPKWLIAIVLVCIEFNLAQLLEGSGKDSNESFGEITLPIPNFTENLTEDSLPITKKEKTPTRVPNPPTFPTPTPNVFNTTKFEYDQFMCTCDLTKSSCDINCCCDEECSIDDKKAFQGGCNNVIKSLTDPRYCYEKNIVDRINGKYKYVSKIDEAGALLCILIDNQEEDLRYIDRKGSTNISEFNSLVSRHRGFIWPEIQDKIISHKKSPGKPKTLSKKEKKNSPKRKQLAQTENVFSIFNAKHYNVGSPIWIYYGDVDELGILCLPQSFNQRGCTTASPVRYMEDLEDKRKCQRQLKYDEECYAAPELDINYYFDGFNVVKSPEHFRNFTEQLPNAKSPFLEIEYIVCTKSDVLSNDEEKSCEKKREIELVSMTPNKLCRNILTALEFKIYHEGTKGITKISVSIELSDFSSNRTFWEYLDEAMIIEQAFSYQHIWNTDNITEITKRSGRPGYQDGMPIRSGKLIQLSGSPEEKSNGNGRLTIPEKNNFWKIDRKLEDQFLTTMGRTLSGDCTEIVRTERNPILFGENLRTGCSFHLTKEELRTQCKMKKKEILQLLLGAQLTNTENLFDSLKNIRVATFGDSEVLKPGDWIPIMLSKFPSEAFNADPQSDDPMLSGKCENMVLNLHIEIAFAKVGSFANPQSKIMGVNYKFGAAHDVTYQCIGFGACKNPSKQQRIEIFSSVQFTDVTLPALDYYAEYPVIEARLPHDFFYPFLTSPASSGTKSTELGNNSVLVIYLCIFHILLLCLIIK